MRLLRGQVLCSTMYAHGHRGALIHFARYRHGAAVQLHQFLHQRQPDARAFRGTRARGLAAMETLEYSREIFR